MIYDSNNKSHGYAFTFAPLTFKNDKYSKGTLVGISSAEAKLETFF